MQNPKIEVHLVPDDDPENVDWNDSTIRTPYFYCVLDWGNGPTWWNGLDSKGPKSIMPGTENGSWYNTGICGWCATPEAAFAEGLARFRAKEVKNQVSPGV